VPVGEGYRGQALNLAARLCSRATPGQVLAGETIIGLARRGAGLVFREQGTATLKGFAAPLRVIQGPPEGEEEGEGGADARLERVAEAVPLAPAEQLDEAPLPVGNFLWARPEHRLVAREQEMRRLLAALDVVQASAGRLVFLVGEAGVGKTRLAQEVTL